MNCRPCQAIRSFEVFSGYLVFQPKAALASANIVHRPPTGNLGEKQAKERDDTISLDMTNSHWPKPFRVKRMLSLAMLDTIREFRYWLPSGNTCPWGFVILVTLVFAAGVMDWLWGLYYFHSRFAVFVTKCCTWFVLFGFPIRKTTLTSVTG